MVTFTNEITNVLTEVVPYYKWGLMWLYWLLLAMLCYVMSWQRANIIMFWLQIHYWFLIQNCYNGVLYNKVSSLRSWSSNVIKWWCIYCCNIDLFLSHRSKMLTRKRYVSASSSFYYILFLLYFYSKIMI